jgi:transcription elongation factor GreA
LSFAAHNSIFAAPGRLRPRPAVKNHQGDTRVITSMEKVPMTAEGYKALDEELKRLKTVERPAVIAQIAEARSHGDLSENAEYHAAKERQGWIEGRIAEIEDRMARAQVIDVSRLSGTQVKFGATVSLVDEDTDEEARYQIVGEHEADVKQGRVSITSPLARAMIGKEMGDVVEVNTPGGVKAYEITKVEWA